MKRMGRQTISVVMSVIILLSCFTGLTFSAGAETSGDYEYKALDDGTVEITKYKGSSSKLNIPSEINGKKVVSIGDYAFQDYEDFISLVDRKSVV